MVSKEKELCIQPSSKQAIPGAITSKVHSKMITRKLLAQNRGKAKARLKAGAQSGEASRKTQGKKVICYAVARREGSVIKISIE